MKYEIWNMKCFPNTKHILLIIDTSSEPKKCQNRQKKWIQWYFFSATLTLLAFIIDQSADIIWILLKSGVGDSVSAFYKGGISGHLLSMELICYTAPDQRDPFKKVCSQSKQGSANAKSIICIYYKIKMSKRGKMVKLTNYLLSIWTSPNLIIWRSSWFCFLVTRKEYINSNA